MQKLLLSVLALVSFSFAGFYEYEPRLVDEDQNSFDLGDLPHGVAVTWGIDQTIAPDAEITSATLTIKNIFNHNMEDNRLFVHLLDDGASDLTFDGVMNADAPIEDYFANQGILIAEYKDLDAWETKEDLVINFSASQLDMLESYIADGNFGFGFDPDCHYYNDGVKFQFTTAEVPEPTLISLLGCGLLGLVFVRRRKS